jgi:hypothetical protein
MFTKDYTYIYMKKKGMGVIALPNNYSHQNYLFLRSQYSEISHF